MNVSDILYDSIRYPSSEWGKILILGVIFIACILIVPIFLVYGYLFRIIKATLAGLNELPEFDEIGDMFVDGLKIFVVSIVYAIPVWIISAIIGLIIGPGMNITTSIGLNPIMFWGLIAANIIAIIIALIIGLIEIVAIVNMAYYDGELEAAFRFSEILEHISRIGWGKYVVTYIIITIIAFIGFLIGILTLFILIGIIILPLIIAPYIVMFATRAIALLFAYTGEVEAVEKRPSEEAQIE